MRAKTVGMCVLTEGSRYHFLVTSFDQSLLSRLCKIEFQMLGIQRNVGTENRVPRP